MAILSIEIWDYNVNGIYSVFYRSPNVNVNLEAINKFDELLENTINLNKFNCIAGDLNIDLNKTNRHTKLIRDIFVKHGLEQNVKFNTRECNVDGTLKSMLF